MVLFGYLQLRNATWTRIHSSLVQFRLGWQVPLDPAPLLGRFLLVGEAVHHLARAASVTQVARPDWGGGRRPQSLQHQRNPAGRQRR